MVKIPVKEAEEGIGWAPEYEKRTEKTHPKAAVLARADLS